MSAAPMTEGQLQALIVLAVGKDPELWLARNNCGSAQMINPRDGSKSYVKYGIGNPGGADLIGIFRGRFVAAEVKTLVGRQSPEQKRFQKLVEFRGGIYTVLRSVDDALAWLADLRRTVPLLDPPTTASDAGVST